MGKAISVAQGKFGRVSLIDVDTRLAEHAHAEIHIIFNVGGPDVPMTVGTQPVVLTRKTAILSNPWVPHTSLREPGTTSRLLVLSLTRPFVAQCLNHQLPPTDAIFRTAMVPVSGIVRLCCMTILAMMRTPSFIRSALVQRFLPHLVQWLINVYGRGWAGQGFAPSGRGGIDMRVQEVMAAIESDITRSHDCAYLSGLIGVSRSRLFSLFKESTGLTPGQYADALRIERATHSLCKSDLPLIDIASDLGFESQGNFSRFFKKQTGVTPSSFRAMSVDLDAHMAQETDQDDPASPN